MRWKMKGYKANFFISVLPRLCARSRGRWMILFIFFSISPQLLAQSLTAKEVLTRTLERHGSPKKWNKTSIQWAISIARKGAKDRHFQVATNFSTRDFVYAVQSDTISYKQGYQNGLFQFSVNGKTEISDAVKKTLDITTNRTTYLKEVYFYLLGLPFILQKDTSLLDSDTHLVTFNTKKCYKLTFRYLPIDENETWEFYIDEVNFQLVGYRFYVKAPSTNGEYIYLDDYKKWKGFLIPMKRTWYWNKDGTYFRTDQIHEVKTAPKSVFVF